jgi:hypothetical protein
VAIARAGAIEPLVALVRGGSARTQGAAASALSHLALDNADNRMAIDRALLAAAPGASLVVGALGKLVVGALGKLCWSGRQHLLTIVAGALLTYAIYSRWTARLWAARRSFTNNLELPKFLNKSLHKPPFNFGPTLFLSCEKPKFRISELQTLNVELRASEVLRRKFFFCLKFPT